jgi:competence protein ComEC
MFLWYRLLIIIQNITPFILLATSGYYLLQVNQQKTYGKTKPINIYVLSGPLINLIIGIYLQQLITFPALLLTCLAIVIVILLSWVTYFCYRRTQQFFLYLLFFVSGALLLQIHKISQEILLAHVGNNEQTLQATITQIDEKATSSHPKSITKTILRLHVTHPTSFDILCYIPSKTNLGIGDIVSLPYVTLKKTKDQSGKIKQPTFADYLLKERVLTSIFVKKRNIKCLANQSFSLTRAITTFRNRIYQRLQEKLTPEAFSYFSTLFLGKKHVGIREKTDHLFNFWGISHYLARSGLHIALFVFLWKTLFDHLPLLFFVKHFLLILMCGAYYLFSWPSISFYRAASVFILFEFGIIFHQAVHFFHLLSLLCMMTLLLNPIQLFFLDFQLSFALTFGLAVLLTNKKIGR